MVFRRRLALLAVVSWVACDLPAKQNIEVHPSDAGLDTSAAEDAAFDLTASPPMDAALPLDANASDSAAPDSSSDAPPDCPSEMVLTPTGSCIDRYEAASGGGTTGASDGSNTTLIASSLPGQWPLMAVTPLQAKKACQNAGKHLCIKDEWGTACTGLLVSQWDDINWLTANLGVSVTYPYDDGTQFIADRCNDWTASNHGDNGPAQGGSFVDCVTKTGVYDIANNLYEIVDTPDESGRYFIEGGSLFTVILDSSCQGERDPSGTLLGTETWGYYHDSQGNQTSWSALGFRCCASAGDPAFQNR